MPEREMRKSAAEASPPAAAAVTGTGTPDTGAPDTGTSDTVSRVAEALPGTVVRIAAALDGMGPVLGVDAGGTSTRAALVVDGAVAERYSSGPFNFLLSEDGVPRMAALARAARPSAVGIGVPGIARQPGAAAAFAAAVSEACGVRTRVATDATVAWLGAFLGGPGIIVIAGTGSVAVGGSPGAVQQVGGSPGAVQQVDGSIGALEQVGGHGHLIGDEGSGYWIGRMALRAALAAAEGTGPPTRLSSALTAAAGAALDELVVRVQRSPGDRSLLTGFAPVVGTCAGGPDEDPVARAIIAGAAAALAALAAALRQRLGELPVAYAGGVFAIPALRAAFRQATGAVAPLAPPEIGAALLAAGREA